MWLCRCSCGQEVEVAANRLTSARPTRSCGCLSADTLRQRRFKHGLSLTYFHRTWSQIVQRCCNPNNPAYPRYGGRGIKVCDRWRHSLEAFAADMGERPSPAHSVDRVDNDGPYSPSNCRWATRTDQARNRQSSHLIAAHGQTRTLQEWADLTGLNRSTIARRIARGLTGERAVAK
jgi:hypothetical protein